MNKQPTMNDKNKRVDFIVNELLVSDAPYRYSETHGGEVFSEGHGENVFSCVEYDVGSMVKRSFTPSHPFLFNFGAGFDNESNDRYYSTDKEYLITDLQSILRGGYEYTMKLLGSHNNDSSFTMHESIRD